MGGVLLFLCFQDVQRGSEFTFSKWQNLKAAARTSTAHKFLARPDAPFTRTNASVYELFQVSLFICTLLYDDAFLPFDCIHK